LVLWEICAAIGGQSAMLSLHPTYGPPSLVAGVPKPGENGGAEAALALAAAFAAHAVEGQAGWVLDASAVAAGVMQIPVAIMEGHGRLVITILFEVISDETVAKAEAVYRQRWPLATGYFRLWQMDRLNRERLLALETAFDQIDTGLLLLSRSGAILSTNASADTMLTADNGLRRNRELIGTTDLADAVALQSAINHVVLLNAGEAEADSRAPAPMLALRRAASPALIVMLVPAARPAVETNDVAILMYVLDPQQDTMAMLAPVCGLYRLSPVESRLVAYLVQGRPLADAAAEMRVKEQTARTYLRQIFHKTDTNRQTELVVLMLSSMLRMRPAILQRARPIANDTGPRQTSAPS
jgi:DNA-binding CsgD family transcriptional regulator